MSQLSVVTKQEPAPVSCDARSRRLWLTVRRALLMVAAAIEKEFGVEEHASARSDHGSTPR